MLNAKVDQISQKSSSSSSVLQIKQDDKFFCRLLSKETSMSNPSFRFSSSSSVNVPFVWESQPGTPKYKLFSQETLPPLTPPPSYHNNNNNINNNALKRVKKNNSRSSSNIFMALFTKMSLKKIIMPSPSSPSPSCSLSSRWTTSDSSRVVPMAKIGRRRFLSYGSSSFDFRGENNEEDGGGSSSPPSSSALCFGISRAMSSNSSFQSSYKRKAQ